MSALKYTSITVASCDPDYLQTAFGHCADIAKALTAGPAISTRFGQITTGDHIGNIIFFSSYPSLTALGQGWDVANASDGFRAMLGSGKAKLVLRNILRLEDVFLPEPPAQEPAFGMVTRFASPTAYVAEMKGLLPIFADNGALITRYGTLLTGSAAGQRLMAVAYPSMEAIEATYDALANSKAYQSAVANADVTFRNLFKFVG